ncbi:hypothetical protein WME75_16785 [Sorangium sp. So ce1014]|uniref:hypothetical protein n=1 Tax=Sorangium sp. So ce1014 TaxID=3133326 RepID=UPI003F5DBD22
MSTRDALLRALPADSRLPEALRAPIEGVSLGHYLIVEAARLDGLPVPAVLAWLDVPQRAFARAEELWSERVSDALACDDERFDALYEDALGWALSLWARPVDPLDRDIGAWMTFQRHALDAIDPGELARRAGLTPGDELRLARLWRARLADPEVLALAEAAMSGPLAPLPAVAVSPFVFPPAPVPVEERP